VRRQWTCPWPLFTLAHFICFMAPACPTIVQESVNLGNAASLLVCDWFCDNFVPYVLLNATTWTPVSCKLRDASNEKFVP
jgi:hypothetical protein